MDTKLTRLALLLAFVSCSFASLPQSNLPQAHPKYDHDFERQRTQQTTVYINEATPVGTTIASLRIPTLLPFNENKVLSHIDEASDPKHQFAVTNGNQLVVANRLRREDNGEYNLKIVSTDRDGHVYSQIVRVVLTEASKINLDKSDSETKWLRRFKRQNADNSTTVFSTTASTASTNFSATATTTTASGPTPTTTLSPPTPANGTTSAANSANGTTSAASASNGSTITTTTVASTTTTTQAAAAATTKASGSLDTSAIRITIALCFLLALFL